LMSESIKDRITLELSNEEAALIAFIREHKAGQHRIIISWSGAQWCVETINLTVRVSPAVGYGPTFEEAWSRAAARLKASECKAGANAGGTDGLPLKSLGRASS
jgi:hypothetical protein